MINGDNLTYQAFQTGRKVFRSQSVSILPQVQFRQILQFDALRHHLSFTLDHTVVLHQVGNVITHHVEPLNVGQLEDPFTIGVLGDFDGGWNGFEKLDELSKSVISNSEREIPTNEIPIFTEQPFSHSLLITKLYE